MQFALISTGSGYLAIILPALMAVIWYLQRFYLATSRQLRLLDLEHKSPLYSLLTETIEGLVTIRAFGWSGRFARTFVARLDDSQRPVYFLYCIQRWLNLVLDMIVAVVGILLVVLATQLRHDGAGALLGVAMTGLVGFSQSLGQFIFFYTELETSLGAIARIKEYSEIQAEDEPGPETKQQVPENWPSRGHIQVERITSHYRYISPHSKPAPPPYSQSLQNMLDD